MSARHAWGRSSTSRCKLRTVAPAVNGSWVVGLVGLQSERFRHITLGSAPLLVPEFGSVVLGQLGKSRQLVAIGTDIASERSHTRAQDADTPGALRDFQRRVGATILFE